MRRLALSVMLMALSCPVAFAGIIEQPGQTFVSPVDIALIFLSILLG